MRATFLMAGALTGLALVVAACGGGSYGGATSPGAGGGSYGGATSPGAGGGSYPGATSPGAAASSVGVNSTQLGQFLVDGNGRTLYLFEGDKGKSSTCYDSCAQVWPPALSTGTPQAGSGVTASELGTTTRRDNSSQVTYHGHPLYYYVADGARGDTKGQDLNQFGASWYVVAPSGNKIG